MMRRTTYRSWSFSYPIQTPHLSGSSRVPAPFCIRCFYKASHLPLSSAFFSRFLILTVWPSTVSPWYQSNSTSATHNLCILSFAGYVHLEQTESAAWWSVLSLAISSGTTMWIHLKLEHMQDERISTSLHASAICPSPLYPRSLLWL